MLFSCGNSESSLTIPDGKLDPCTLRFSWWGGDDRHEATLEAVELWHKIHPEIKIKSEYGGWDGWAEKVNTQISSATEPDIIQINYDWLVTLSADGKGFYDLGSLSDFIDLSAFEDDVLSFGMVDGRLNAITVSVSGRGLFYNSEVFERLGVGYPTTWESLMETGRIFEKYGKYPIDLDVQSGSTAWYLAVVYVQQKTGRDFIDMDGNLCFSADDIKSALDFYRELEEKHVIRTVRTRIDEDGNTALYQSPEFINGNIAGVLEWGSAVGKYADVLPENALVAGDFLTDGNGSSGGWFIKPSLMYAVSAKTKYPDECACFIDFLLNDEKCADILGTSRGIPASSRAEKRLAETGRLSGLVRQNDEMLENLETVTVSPYMELARVKQFCNDALEKVSYGVADTRSTAQELHRNITDYLESLK